MKFKYAIFLCCKQKMMKFLFVVLGFFVALDVSAFEGGIQYDNLLIGKIDPISRLLHAEYNLAMPYTLKHGGIQKLDWKYPLKDGVENKWIISHILFFSYYENMSTDPHIELIEGGPGHYNCSLRFISYYHMGFNFTILVYAYIDLDSPEILNTFDVVTHPPFWQYG